MADQREVTLSLGVKPQGDIAKPLKDLAAATKDAAAAEERYGKLLEKTIAGMKEREKVQRDMARVARDISVTRGASFGSAVGGAVGGGYGSAAGTYVGGGVAGGVHAMGGVAGIAAAAGAIDKGFRGWKDWYEHGVRTERTWKEGIYDAVHGVAGAVPLAGGYFQDVIEGTPLGRDIGRRREERKNRLTGAYEAQQRRAVEEGIRFAHEDRNRRFELELSATRARQNLGTGLGGRNGIAGAFNAAEQQAMLAAGGRYSREAEQADISRRFATERGLALSGLEAQRWAYATNSELGALSGQRADQQRRLDEQNRRVGSARANVGAGGDIKDQEEKLVKLQTELNTQKELQQRLDQTIGQETSVRLRQEQEIKAAGEERVRLLMQEQDTINGIKIAESNRLQGMKESFGLLKPMERHAAVRVAQKIKAGQSLTGSELEFAKSHGNLFENQLRKIGDQAAGKEWQQFSELTGQNDRLNQLGQQGVQIEHRIQVEVKGTDQALADQINKQVTPGIVGQIKQSELAAVNAMDRLTVEQKIQRQAALRY